MPLCIILLVLVLVCEYYNNKNLIEIMKYLEDKDSQENKPDDSEPKEG